MKKSELTIDVIRWLIAVVVSIALIFASTTAYNAFKPAEPDEVLTGAAQGMLSEITVSVAMKDGVIMSAEATEGGETPELGGVAIEHYNTDYLPTLVGKAVADVDPSEIDTVSGATITSNAFIAALKQALGIEEVAPVEEPAPAEDTAPTAEGETLSATAKGMGDVTVTLTVSDGVITAASIEGANETAGLGADVIANANEGFMADLVGKTLADVDPASFDVVSGSTLTSNAIIEALGQIVGAEAAPVEETPAAEEPATTAEGKTLSATAKGMGDVTVTLTVSDGVITAASIEGANETAGLGADVIANANEGFMADLVGKTLSDVDPASFDVVSGCTVTSNAIIDALGQIVGK